MTTNWNAILVTGKPVVTVSAGAISGSGADFGSDSTSNATPGVVGTGTLTTTSGIQGAINYLQGTIGGGTAYLLYTPDAPFAFSGSITIGSPTTATGIVALVGQPGVLIQWSGNAGIFLTVDHSYLDAHYLDALPVGVPLLSDFTVELSGQSAGNGPCGVKLIQVQNAFLMTRVRVISTVSAPVVQTAILVSGYGILCTLDRCDILYAGSPSSEVESIGLQTEASDVPDLVQQFTVRNCRIEGWYYGINHSGASRAVYQGNLIQDNVIGAWIVSYVPTFRDNWFENNSTSHVGSVAALEGWMVFEDNHFDNRSMFSGSGSLSTAAVFRRNDGVNPYGLYSSPFSTAAGTIVPQGSSVSPASGTIYQVNYCDVIINSSGGSGVTIDTYDNLGNVLISGLASVSNLYLPVGFQIKFTYSSAPSVTVAGV